MTKSDWHRFWLHLPVGVACALIGVVNPVNGMAGTVAFLAYEVLNDWRKVDSSYKDVFGFATGLIVTFLGVYLWRLI